jgi:hypothetical protein
MAETPKAPKQTLSINFNHRRSNDHDDYEQYMRAVLRQAVKRPDVAPLKRTH